MLPANTALTVVDVQQGFRDPSWGPRNHPEAESNVARLLAAWRRGSRPIHHVHHASRSILGRLYPGTPGHVPQTQAAPVPGEPIHVKSVHSGFIGTSLEHDLRAKGLTTLVIARLTTNHCVSTTARMASNLGFATYVVEDATATFDRMGLGGEARPAAEVHAAALSDLSGEFATVLGTDEVVGAVKSSSSIFDDDGSKISWLY